MREALILNKRKDLEFSHESRLAHVSHAETPLSQPLVAFASRGRV